MSMVILPRQEIDPQILARTYTGQFGAPPAFNGDTDGDGDFDFDDIPGFVTILGGGSGQAASVPEPSSLLLAAIGLLGLLAAGRRTRQR